MLGSLDLLFCTLRCRFTRKLPVVGGKATTAFDAGRAMELGRECLKIWGYTRVDELIWVKTNQLQRLIRTGRTGHWLNQCAPMAVLSCSCCTST